MKLKTILIINLVIGIFASISHFPVLAFKLAGLPEFQSIKLWAILPILPLDLTLLLGSIVGLLANEGRKEKIVVFQTFILIIFSTLLLGFLFWVILTGFPEGNFSWSPGIGASFVGYSTYLWSRFLYRGDNKHIRYFGWYSAGIVFLLELSLMYKFYTVYFA